MAYTINKTDGSLLTEIIDSAIDTTATDLSLIGKNVTGYGELINENFVKLLENFASTSEPNNPIAGQLWFDQTDNRLKVYDGNGFAIASGPIVSGTAPLTPNQGDFWIDNKEKQLYFYDGTRSRFLAGKIWSDSQGKSGFEVNTTFDSFGNRKTITYLWNAGNLLGIFSNHAAFEPNTAIPGITTIKPGFTVSTNATDFKINAPAESADFLQSSTGDLIPADDFLIFNQENNLTETLTISNNTPLILGAGAEATILVGAGLTEIRNQIGQDFKISVLDDPSPILFSKTASKQLGIFNNNPQAALDVTGDVIVGGNLTVNGTTTTINSTNISVDDKNIELAKIDVPTDAFAQGGGIILKGDSDHLLLWERSIKFANELIIGKKYVINTVGSTVWTALGAESNTSGITFTASSVGTGTGTAYEHSWKSSENFELPQGYSYKINNADVLTETFLGSSVIDSSLTSVGILNNLKVGSSSSYVEINDNNIITTVGGGTLTLSSSTSIIDVSEKRITRLSNPIFPSDAVSKQYLESVSFKPWAIIASPIALSENGDRFLIDATSSTITVSLPKDPNPGSTVRFVDYGGDFATNPLTIVRSRDILLGSLSGVAVSNALPQTFNVATISDTGVGTGLELEITVDALSILYQRPNISVTNPGISYKDGDEIRVLGSLLGGSSPTNDLSFTLELKNILGRDNDLTISIPNSSFTLVYTSQSQGWQYADSVFGASSFSLPILSTAQRDLKVPNYGELIYNSDSGKTQAYVAPGIWVDLH